MAVTCGLHVAAFLGFEILKGMEKVAQQRGAKGGGPGRSTARIDCL